MVRHAYHSPDILLKIRKANEKNGGSASKAEGVPWRHRLGIRERREFVMAEIKRPGVGRERSRGSELDIQRAVMAARNPKDSKFGECLINVNTKQDPILKSNLRRLTTERRRMEYRMQQLKQHFVKNNPCLNHEPLILVERPASPEVRHRARVIEDYGEDPEDLKKPGYMRPLKSRCKTPSTLTTIDAFTLKTKKKRNVWEEAMDEKEAPRFTSTVRPSARLTRHEQLALSLGWDAHKPKVDVTKRADSPPPRNAITAATTNTATPSTKPRRETKSQPMTPVFITELPRNKDVAKTPDGRLLKSLVLDQLLAITPPPHGDSESLPARSGEGPSQSQPAQNEEGPSQKVQEEEESRPATAKSGRKTKKTVTHRKQDVLSRRMRKVAISETPVFIKA